MLTHKKTILFIFYLFISISLFAQSFPKSKSEQEEIIERLCKLLKNRYINENQSSRIADSLRVYFENRRYAKENDDPKLAFALNQDLYHLSQDRGLSIQSKFTEVITVPNQVKKRWIYKIFPSMMGKAYRKQVDSVLNAKKEKWYAVQNYGLRSAQLLDGGIGYWRIDAFYDHKQALNNLKNTAYFFEKTNYLLLDLSRFNGGQAEAVAYFTSFFVPKQTALFSLKERELMKGQTATREKIREFRSKKSKLFLGDKNIYVLTSKRTAASAELLIHLLKKYCQNVQIIGANTAGITTLTKEPKNTLEHVFGDGTSSWYYLASDKALVSSLELHLPEIQLLLPSPDTTWENKGFFPDIVCKDTLMRFAHLQALKDKIREEPLYNDRQFIDFQYNLLTLSKQKLPNSSVLERYVGNYEKERKIILKDNSLYLQRGKEELVRLIPLGEKTFFCETAYQSGFYFNNRLQTLFKIRFAETSDKKLKMNEITADNMENRSVFLKLD